MSALMPRQTVKSGMPVIIASCSHKTFYAEYTCNVREPDVKKAIINRVPDGAGIRATARGLGVSPDTVIKELKKTQIDYANKNYLESHKNIIIRIETDEMRGFYYDKKRQIWLWQATGH
jgi:hypothetical protein